MHSKDFIFSSCFWEKTKIATVEAQVFFRACPLLRTVEALFQNQPVNPVTGGVCAEPADGQLAGFSDIGQRVQLQHDDLALKSDCFINGQQAKTITASCLHPARLSVAPWPLRHSPHVESHARPGWTLLAQAVTDMGFLWSQYQYFRTEAAVCACAFSIYLPHKLYFEIMFVFCREVSIDQKNLLSWKCKYVT